MLKMQTEFYNLLVKHANYWGKAQYFTMKRNPQLAMNFLAHQQQIRAMADYINSLTLANFAKWLYLHQIEYVHLYFHISFFHARIAQAA